MRYRLQTKAFACFNIAVVEHHEHRISLFVENPLDDARRIFCAKAGAEALPNLIQIRLRHAELPNILELFWIKLHNYKFLLTVQRIFLLIQCVFDFGKFMAFPIQTINSFRFHRLKYNLCAQNETRQYYTMFLSLCKHLFYLSILQI